MVTYPAGAQCVGLAVDMTLGDVPAPAPPPARRQARRLVACAPYVVRLTGDGAGRWSTPRPSTWASSSTSGRPLDMLALIRRPDGTSRSRAPARRRELRPGACISYDLDGEQLVCDTTPVQGPLAVGDLNGTGPVCRPTRSSPAKAGTSWASSASRRCRPCLVRQHAQRAGRPRGLTRPRVGGDRRPRQRRRPRRARRQAGEQPERPGEVDPLLPVGRPGLDQVAPTLPSTPGLDAVAIADVDGDGRNDVGRGYGRA